MMIQNKNSMKNNNNSQKGFCHTFFLAIVLIFGRQFATLSCQFSDPYSKLSSQSPFQNGNFFLSFQSIGKNQFFKALNSFKNFRAWLTIHFSKPRFFLKFQSMAHNPLFKGVHGFEGFLIVRFAHD
jgi:hypothetical protein